VTASFSSSSLTAANQFYQLLFSNSPLAIPLQQFIFPLQNLPPAILPSAKNTLSKNLLASFNESFVSSGKQGGRATVLGERHGIEEKN
jgi:hypothetical protein